MSLSDLVGMLITIGICSFVAIWFGIPPAQPPGLRKQRRRGADTTDK